MKIRYQNLIMIQKRPWNLMIKTVRKNKLQLKTLKKKKKINKI